MTDVFNPLNDVPPPAENDPYKFEGPLTDEHIAQVVHEANRVLQGIFRTPGVPMAPAWDYFPKDQREGVIRGVAAMRADPDITPEASHESWVWDKLGNGWVLGDVKDAIAKTHPNLVPYADLPENERLKDHVFSGIVHALI